jgi:integrase
VVYIVLKYGKQKKVFSSNVKCKNGTYNVSTQEIAGEPLETTKLQGLIFKCKQLIVEFEVTERTIDLELIKASALGLVSASIPNIQELFNEHLLKRSDDYKVGDIRLGTFKKERTWHRHIKDYFANKYGVKAPLNRIVPADAETFINWLKVNRHLCHNSALHVGGHVKRVLNYSMENEWTTVNKFMNFKKKAEKKIVESLTESEIEKLEKINLLDERLKRAKDVFLFMIYTGLSYTDCYNLREKHINQLATGEYFIFKERDKTKIDTTVYLIKKARAIMTKYENDPYCNNYGFLVPVLSNQKINIQLKAIQQIAGISRNITCHLARKTFATIMYNASIEERALTEMMGHTNSATTKKYYINVDPKTTVESMKKAAGNSSFGT